jgi:hypothetical protein
MIHVLHSQDIVLLTQAGMPSERQNHVHTIHQIIVREPWSQLSLSRWISLTPFQTQMTCMPHLHNKYYHLPIGHPSQPRKVLNNPMTRYKLTLVVASLKPLQLNVQPNHEVLSMILQPAFSVHRSAFQCHHTCAKPL